MSKKLVTKDSKLLSEVENVLKQKNIPCVRVHWKFWFFLIVYQSSTNKLYKIQNGDAVKSDELLLAVTNKDGEAMRNAIKSIKTDSKYYFGVLRNHPEYTIPKGIMKELAEESLKARIERAKEEEE